MAKRKTHPIIPAMLSFVVMGTGQIFNGERDKGIALLLIVITSFVIGVVDKIFYAESMSDPIYLLLRLITSIIVIFIWIWNIYDAYKNAK